MTAKHAHRSLSELLQIKDAAVSININMAAALILEDNESKRTEALIGASAMGGFSTSNDDDRITLDDVPLN
jgi:hypothetical protein